MTWTLSQSKLSLLLSAALPVVPVTAICPVSALPLASKMR